MVVQWPVTHTDQERQSMLLFIMTNCESTWAVIHEASLPPTAFICSTSSAVAFSDLQWPTFSGGWSTASPTRGNPYTHPVLRDRNPNTSACLVPPLSQRQIKMLLRGQISWYHGCTLNLAKHCFILHICISGLSVFSHQACLSTTFRDYHVRIMARKSVFLEL